MPKITTDADGRFTLPADFVGRRGIAFPGEYWLDDRGGDLTLRPRVPDTHKLYVEPTTGCNLHCRTCIRHAWGDPEAKMSPQTFQHIIESMAGLPDLKRVVFSGFGEPLSHPDLLEMIGQVRQRDLAVSVGSNGLLLTQEKARALVRLGVDRLVISIDGAKPETYADVRGALLSQVLGNVRYLNEAKAQLGSLFPALGIEFVALKSNLAELGELAGLASRLNASRVLVSNVIPYTEEMREQVLYGYEPRPPFKAAGWPVRADAWVIWGTLELPRMHWGAERHCRFIQDKSMVIGWDGGVSPCYALSHQYGYFAIDGGKKQVSRYLLGNVNEQSLAEIWMSEEYVNFRGEVRGFHFPSCANCELRASCDLRERNEACWGWNPSCADCLWAQDIVRCP